MPPRIELNLPAYKRLGYTADPNLVQKVKAAVYRETPSYQPGKSTMLDWQQRPQTITDTIAPSPELQPITRYNTGLQSLQDRPTAVESIGQSYQNRTTTILQSGVDATQTVQQIMAAKQAEIEAKQQQKLMRALTSSRNATGAVVPSQQLPQFSGRINFSDYGERYYSPAQNKQIAQRVASSMGLSSQDFRYLDYIIQKESSYRNTVKNPGGSAYGLGQFLKGTWATVGGRKTSNPALQIYYMIKYAFKRYGSIYKAYLFKVANGWY